MAMPGAGGVLVLEAVEGHAELVITIEAVASFVGCGHCGVRDPSQVLYVNPEFLEKA